MTFPNSFVPPRPVGDDPLFSWKDTLVNINGTDNFINEEHDTDHLLQVASVGAVLLVVPVNIYVLYWIEKKDNTLVDSMILLDCVANLGQ